MTKVIKSPTAFLPIAMSVAAIALVVVYVAAFGVTQEPQSDEGLAARIFQLLLAGQVPIMMCFAVQWLPKVPKNAVLILAIQALGILSAFGLISFLER
jgi:hypothetical protein